MNPSDAQRGGETEAGAPGPWRNALLLFLFAVAMHAMGTWLLPLVDRDEPRFAEASREMLERRDWVVPYLNHEYRFDKPPLTYWLQVLSFDAFGESDWAARLPSVLASALTTLAIYGFGRRAIGERAGWWAAMIFTTSLQVVIHSKLCVADPFLVLFVTIAAWAGWEMIAARRAGRPGATGGWNALFVAALALGFLAKGPVAWLPLGMLGWMRIRKVARAPSWLALFLSLLASLALVAIWGWPALQETNGSFFRVGIGRHVVARGLSGMEGHGARGPLLYVALLPFYLVTVFFSFFPWSIRLPWLVGRLRGRAGQDDLGSYLVAGIVLVFGLFTVYNTRLPHYILPAFPLLALLLAREWLGAARSLKSFRIAVWGMAAFNLIAALAIFPMVKKYTPAFELAGMSESYLKPEMEFASTGFAEPSLVWYFRHYVRGFHTILRPDQIPAYMEKSGPRFCILSAAEADRLYPVLPPGWVVGGEVGGFNPVKGRSVDLRMLIKPD